MAVAGGGSCDREVAALARAVGSGLARGGAVVICGGLGGVMEAVAAGAAEEGGLVVGLLPGYDRGAGNPSLTVAVPTGIGHARNALVAAAGDCLVALPGAAGTLSEVALACVLGRPVIGVRAWGEIAGVVRVETAEEAVRLALATAARGEFPA